MSVGAGRVSKRTTTAASYQNDATSSDGTNFDCFIGNSNSNIYDMFLTIYADALRRGELPAGELSLNRIPRPPPTQTSEAFVEENEEQGS